MSGGIRRTLEELIDLRPQDLPRWCNVYVRITDPPTLIRAGDRWDVGVEGLSGRAKARIAVHVAPPPGFLELPYARTSTHILAIFQEPALRQLLIPGETCLVQAAPRIGDQGTLWLNVASILLLRPFHNFGRKIIDYETACDRKRYLTVTKGVAHDRKRVFHTGTVAGVMVDDLLAKAATSGLHADDEEVLAEALSPEALESLVYLGLRRSDDLTRSLDSSRRALEVLRSSPSVGQLLKSDRWFPESDRLGNGVSILPDLLGDRHVVEMKFVSPNGDNYKPNSYRRQVTDYLSWAMTEYGVETVLQDWRGVLLQLHRDVEEDQRVTYVEPSEDQIAKRIVNRHRLLAVLLGGWLPAPETSTCEYCEYGLPNAATREESGDIPAPCLYHCQAERGWDCWSADGSRACPLLSQCDQFGIQMPFERLDHFNRLRRILVEEEEEVFAVRQIQEAMTESGEAEACGMILGGFTVLEHGRVLRLGVPDALKALEFGHRGQAFEVLRNGISLGIVSVRKTTPEVLTVSGGRLPALAASAQVALRQVPAAGTPAREQLAFIEHSQRLGQEPLSMRSQEARTSPFRHTARERLEDVDLEAAVVLIDAGDRADEARAIQFVLDREPGRVLIIAPPHFYPESVGAFDLSGIAIADAFQGASGSSRKRLDTLLSDAAAKRVWSVPREHLFGDAFDILAGMDFSLVLCPSASTLPMVLIRQCLNLHPGKPLVLVGQAAASGPRHESPSASTSVFGQNTLAFLMEAAEYFLPARVDHVETVRLAASRAVEGVVETFGMPPAREVIPLVIHSVSPVSLGSPSVADHDVRLTVMVPPTPGHIVRREVTLVLEDDRVSVHTLQVVLRGVNARMIESLGVGSQGHIDTTVLGYRARIAVCDMQTQLVSAPLDHRLTVAIPAARFPFIQEHGLANMAEAEALLDYAELHPNEAFHATSPFLAQCVLLSRRIAERRLKNLRVLISDILGTKKPGADRVLLVSTVVSEGNPGYPQPVSASRLVNYFVGGYRQVHLFATEAALMHHPLLRRLKG